MLAFLTPLATATETKPEHRSERVCRAADQGLERCAERLGEQVVVRVSFSSFAPRSYPLSTASRGGMQYGQWWLC